MAASRINFMAANFSYAPDLTKTNFMDAVTKFMVSGFGPFNIDKIKVTDKVVRVTTSEKNFYSLPGCKLAISGTGVAALDDRHELLDIYKDGFSFALDTPNAEFTNGLTYSVPSLGWTLVKQTAVQTIYRSTDAVTPFYLIINKRAVGGYVDVRYDYHTIYIAYNLDEAQEPIAQYPTPQTDSVQMLPIHPYTNYSAANLAARFNYFFYGDGASVIIAGDAGTTTTLYSLEAIKNGEMGCLSSSCIGEMKSTGPQLPLTYIVGTRVSQADFLTNWRPIAWQRGNNTSPGLCGYTGTSTTFVDALFGGKVSDSYLNFAIGGAIFPKHVYNQWSGGRPAKSPTWISNQTEMMLQPMSICDNLGYRIGLIPGVYTLDQRPGGIEGEPHRKFTVNINNRERRGVLVRTSSNGSNASGGGNTAAENDAVTFLDLTGPIR